MTIYAPGKLTLSKIQQYPAVIGEPWGGGYFAGYISHTADGNPTHALIVAPRETGATGTGYTLTTDLAWKNAVTTTTGTDSPYDGAANTAAMVAAGINDHPAAKFCTELVISGFDDWYLPSRYELEIAYFNLKPTVDQNLTTYGSSIYSVPPRASSYTLAQPSRTYISIFQSGGAEPFVDEAHWSSTEQTSARGWAKRFNNGDEIGNVALANKTTSYRVRAFRRIALP